MNNRFYYFENLCLKNIYKLENTFYKTKLIIRKKDN